MGCDIHINTEVRQTINGVKKWYNWDNWGIDPYYTEGSGGGQEYEVREVIKGRNYRLFSVLADVRNDSCNKPICQPKGIPDDLSPQTRRRWADWGCDGHSYSHFTLKELMDFAEKNPITLYSGKMSVDQAKALDGGVYPDSWCADTSDTSYVYREWERPGSPLNYLIEAIKDLMLHTYVVYGENQIDGRSEDVRIVFWFDN